MACRVLVLAVPVGFRVRVKGCFRLQEVLRLRYRHLLRHRKGLLLRMGLLVLRVGLRRWRVVD